MGIADFILDGEGDLYDMNEYHMLAHMAEAIPTTVVPIRILIRTTVVPITPHSARPWCG